ncbi:MAG TPA: PEP-CTERM sorting domain-containing protein [Terriglobales bacterium]
MLAVLGFVEQSLNFVQTVPEPARLLLLGLGLLWSGAALRKTLRLDHAVESEPFAFEESIAIPSADFRIGKEESHQEPVNR